MTPTSTLLAVRVWLRASERISVRVLGMGQTTIRSWPDQARAGRKRKIEICGMIASRDHFRREPYLRQRRPRAADSVPRRMPDAFARAGQYSQNTPAESHDVRQGVRTTARCRRLGDDGDVAS
jgi:hypothetical protein